MEKSIKELAFRLKDIELEKSQLEINIIKLNEEYNKIVLELWDRIPSLKGNLKIMRRNDERLDRK